MDIGIQVVGRLSRACKGFSLEYLASMLAFSLSGAFGYRSSSFFPVVSGICFYMGASE